MTGLAEITLVGLVVTDPELHVTSTGTVATFTVAANARRLDPATSQWVDTETTLLPCSIGCQAADNVAGSLTQGTRVVILGVLQQREWQTTQGDKHYAYDVHATEIGVSIRYTTVQVAGADTAHNSKNR